jgi:IclR family mhp operon transcriptional activator
MKQNGAMHGDPATERGVPIRSVSRSLAVLKVINAAGSLSLMEIARLAGLPYATVVRLVATLVHEGMVEREPSRKNYRPTGRVQSLSSGYDDQLSVTSRPHIAALTLKHGCAATVSTRFGFNMIVRETTHSEACYNLTTYYPGFVYPLPRSASGLVYMAFASPSERRDLVGADQIDAVGGGAITEQTLRAIQFQGFATEEGGGVIGSRGRSSAIAAPIFRERRLVGALALMFSAATLSMEEAVDHYAEDVVDTARAVGISLGASRAPARKAPLVRGV